MRGGALRAAVEPEAEAPEQQDGEDGGVLQRLAHVGLHEPIIMNDAESSGDVDRAMENPPAFAAEAANPAGSGCDGKRNQEHESGEADRDVAAPEDVGPHVVEIEEAIEADPRGEVEAGVEKSEKAQHAAETNEQRQSEKFAQRCDGESDEKEANGPVAEPVLDELDRVGRQIAVKCAPHDDVEGNKAKEEDDDLGPFAGEDGIYAGAQGQ